MTLFGPVLLITEGLPNEAEPTECELSVLLSVPLVKVTLWLQELVQRFWFQIHGPHCSVLGL